MIEDVKDSRTKNKATFKTDELEGEVDYTIGLVMLDWKEGSRLKVLG